MKPEINLAPARWAQLAPGADLVVSWDASAVAGFGMLGVVVGTSRGDGDLAAVVSVDPTDSLAVPAANLPAEGLVYVTAYLAATESAGYELALRSVGWPDHSTIFAELADRFAVEAALSAVELADVQAIAGANWQGLLHIDTPASADDVASSGDLAAPTIWARWAISYSPAPMVCFDDHHAVTSGVVVIDIYYEFGASNVLALGALALYRSALKLFEATAGGYAFFVEAPSETIASEALPPFQIQRLAVPFKGL